DRGSVSLKGLSEPVHLYEVVWSGDAQADLAVPAHVASLPLPRLPQVAPSASPLVGRARQVEDLRARIAALRDGRGGTLLVARAAPTVLLVEDLHWADEGTLAVLQFLAAEAAPTPYVIVGSYRSDELHRRHRLRPFLAALARRPDVATIDLAPLGSDDALQLL